MFADIKNIDKDYLPASILRMSIVVVIVNLAILLLFVSIIDFKNIIKVPASIEQTGLVEAVIAHQEGTVVFEDIANNQKVQQDEVIAVIEDPRDTDQNRNTANILKQINPAMLLSDPIKYEQILHELEHTVPLWVVPISNLQSLLKDYFRVRTLDKDLLQSRDAVMRAANKQEESMIEVYQNIDSINARIMALLEEDYERDSILYSELTLSKDQLSELEMRSLRERSDMIDHLIEQSRMLQARSIREDQRISLSGQYQKLTEELKAKILQALQLVDRNVKIWEADMVIKSPFTGWLLYDETRERKYVRRGDTLAFMVKLNPEQSESEVLLYVPKKFINYLEIGNKVKLKVDEYPYIDFGILEANLTTKPEEPIGDRYICKATLKNGLKTNYGIQLRQKNFPYTATSEISINEEPLIQKLKKRLLWKYRNLRS